MRQLALSLAILSTALLATESSAEKPDKWPADGPRAAAGQDGPGDRGPGGPLRDPAKMVARMIAQFDKDGDEKLDATELTAMFTAMRERRGGGRMRPGARGERRRGGFEPSTPGGDRPERPRVQ